MSNIIFLSEYIFSNPFASPHLFRKSLTNSIHLHTIPNSHYPFTEPISGILGSHKYALHTWNNNLSDPKHTYTLIATNSKKPLSHVTRCFFPHHFYVSLSICLVSPCKLFKTQIAWCCVYVCFIFCWWRVKNKSTCSRYPKLSLTLKRIEPKCIAMLSFNLIRTKTERNSIETCSKQSRKEWFGIVWNIFKCEKNQ